MISQRTIQEVINVAQTAEVLEDYVTLKRRGANMIGLCPFHDEKTPSFSVSPSKNIYKCFGCGKGGNAINFLMEHDQLSYPEAIRTLAKRYNITIEEDNKGDDEAYKEQKKLEESYYIINNFAGDYFKSNLHETTDGKVIAMPYFKERGFLESTIKKFDLGFAPDGYKTFTEKAIKNQFKEEYLKELGLVSQKGYDFFRNRVMFTIHNVSGKIIAFAGRTLSTDKKQPKYINSPETPIYNKSKVLYALHLAKTAIRKKDNCYIVEGYTDVISLFQNGVENVVASSGTALTSGQVRLVKRYTDNITFLYDGDAAGVKAALRGMDIVLENDMNVKLVLLPDNEDPDSYMRKVGTTEFESFIEENAKDFIHFKMDLLLEEAGNDPIKKSKVIKDIISSIAKVREPIKRSLYLRQCSQSIDVAEKTLVREVNKLIREDIRQKRLEKERAERQDLPPDAIEEEAYYDRQFEPEPQRNFTKKRHEFQEKDLARIVVSAGDKIVRTNEDQEVKVVHLIHSNIKEVIGYFENDMYRNIIEEAVQFVDSDQASNLSLMNHFINHASEEIKSFAINCNASKYHYADWAKKDVFLQTQSMPEENFFKDSLYSIKMFKLRKYDIILKTLRAKMNNEEKEKNELITLKAWQVLQNQRRELAEEIGAVVLDDK
ncbi:MAG: DNA primase [Saprospiraceae bacterium]|nr:DNA primase [Saprospiraceae bacterium]